MKKPPARIRRAKGKCFEGDATVCFDRGGNVRCPDTVYAKAGETIVWNIVNDSNKDVDVWFGSFKEKSNPGSGSPMSTGPGRKKVGAGKTGSSKGTIKQSRRGQHGACVYEYTISYQFDGENEVGEDPEIIIEWP